MMRDDKLNVFFETVRMSRERALLLDYDGTLAPFQIDPAEAFPYSGVSRILDEIIADGASRVVLISGRRAKDLPGLIGLKGMPEVWGSHGWERVTAEKGYVKVVPERGFLDLLAEVTDWLPGVVSEGARVEEKPASLAIHWRGLSQEKAGLIRSRVMERWSGEQGRGGMTLHGFDGGIEFRATGWDKGVVVSTILGELGAGAAAAYLGDDLTDEDAFRAIKGRGLGVLVREEYRETEAEVWIRPPGELIEFLERWQRNCKGQ